jgi:acyl-CoA reductase-like NAD-dependent aldehyde dehydrogenase
MTQQANKHGLKKLMFPPPEAMTGVENSLAELRQTFRSGRTRSVAWRKNQLRALLDLIRDKEDLIFEALHQDLGKLKLTVMR